MYILLITRLQNKTGRFVLIGQCCVKSISMGDRALASHRHVSFVVMTCSRGTGFLYQSIGPWVFSDLADGLNGGD